jgi:hypothetical protein
MFPMRVDAVEVILIVSREFASPTLEWVIPLFLFFRPCFMSDSVHTFSVRATRI